MILSWQERERERVHAGSVVTNCREMESQKYKFGEGAV